VLPGCGRAAVRGDQRLGRGRVSVRPPGCGVSPQERPSLGRGIDRRRPSPAHHPVPRDPHETESDGRPAAAGRHSACRRQHAAGRAGMPPDRSTAATSGHTSAISGVSSPVPGAISTARPGRDGPVIDTRGRLTADSRSARLRPSCGFWWGGASHGRSFCREVADVRVIRYDGTKRGSNVPRVVGSATSQGR
jgi:hypothetical protein